MNVIERFRKYRKGGQILKFQPGGSLYDSRGLYGTKDQKDYLNFSGDMYKTAYEALRGLNYDHTTSDRLSRFITMHKAMESSYGNSIYNNLKFNYGGFGGPNSNINFSGMKDYINTYLKTALKMYPNIFKAKTLKEYSDALFADNYGYAPFDKNGISLDNRPKAKYDKKKSQEIYFGKLNGMATRVNNNIKSWSLMYNYKYNEPIQKPKIEFTPKPLIPAGSVRPPMKKGYINWNIDLLR